MRHVPFELGDLGLSELKRLRSNPHQPELDRGLQELEAWTTEAKIDETFNDGWLSVELNLAKGITLENAIRSKGVKEVNPFQVKFERLDP